MTTLITAGKSDGPMRRCDAKCYDAADTVCTCICGGANHGRGVDDAARNTREHALELIAALPDHHGTLLPCRDRQIPLC